MNPPPRWTESHVPLLLNQREAAFYLGVDTATVRKAEKLGMIRRVDVPGIETGFFRRSDLDRFAAELRYLPSANDKNDGDGQSKFTDGRRRKVPVSARSEKMPMHDLY